MLLEHLMINKWTRSNSTKHWVNGGEKLHTGKTLCDFLTAIHWGHLAISQPSLWKFPLCLKVFLMHIIFRAGLGAVTGNFAFAPWQLFLRPSPAAYGLILRPILMTSLTPRIHFHSNWPQCFFGLIMDPHLVGQTIKQTQLQFWPFCA